MSTTVPVSPARSHTAPEVRASLPGRLAGVVRAPRATFRQLAAAPDWVGALAATTAITFLCDAFLFGTGVGRFALVDRWERTALAFGQPIDEARYQALHAAAEHGVAYAALAAASSGPLLVLGLSSVLYATGTRLLGGRARFRQVLAVVAFAGVILAARELVGAPVAYARETLASPLTLSSVFRLLDEASPLARLFSLVDLFVVWWLAVLAIGLSVLYDRPAPRLAAALAGGYAAGILALTLAMAALGGTA